MLVIAWALPLTGAILIAVILNEPVEDESIQDVISIETLAAYALFCTFILTMSLGWLRPRLGLWVMMGCLLVLAPSTRSPDEFAIEIFWFGLLITDLVLAKRQTTLARDLQRPEHRFLNPEPFLSLERRAPWVSWVLSGMSRPIARHSRPVVQRPRNTDRARSQSGITRRRGHEPRHCLRLHQLSNRR